MSKLTKAWIEAQIEHELERGNHPDAVRDLAALVTVRNYFCEQEGDEMRQYGRRYTPDRPKMMHGAGHEAEHRMGMAEGDDMHLSREDAEKWVESMQDADGKRGGRWTFEEIERYAPNFGVKHDEIVDFFAVLNALYTDYSKVAKKFGFDRMEVWAELAKAFIHDEDAEPGKVKTYYESIAKKGEE